MKTRQKRKGELYYPYPKNKFHNDFYTQFEFGGDGKFPIFLKRYYIRKRVGNEK